MIKRIINYRNKAVTGILLLSIALSSCGRTSYVEVTDYGDTNTLSASKSDASSEESPGYFKEDDANVKIDLKIDEEFTYNDITYSVKCDYKKDRPHDELDIYHVLEVSDDSNIEDNMVESVFGGTAKKLDQISVKEDTEYVPLVSKYRIIKSKLTGKPKDVQYDDYEFYVNLDSLVTLGSNETCKWEDTDKYYIHLYEGMYNKVRFGLIYAYDKVENVRYVYFKPVSINEYFPEYKFKTLMLRNSTDNNGYQCVGNVCNSEDIDIQGTIQDFIDNKLGLSNEYTKLGNSFNEYTKRSWSLIGYDTGETGNKAEKSMTQLVFSDDDFVHSIVNYDPVFNRDGIETHNVDQFPRSVEQLTAQENRMEDSLKKGNMFFNSLYDPYKYLEWDEERDNNTSFTYDGYALYLNPGYIDTEESIDDSNYFSYDYSANAPVNCGVIEVTSKGILGADIIQVMEVENVEPSRLVNSDTIKNKLIEALKSEKYTGKFAGKTDVDVLGANLFYYYNTSDSQYAPTWDFYMISYDKSSINDADYDITPEDYIHVYIDASTGKVLSDD